MAFVVETGAGLITSTSYAAESVLQGYADDRGYTLASGDNETALVRGTQFIETWRARFPGYRTHGRAQALEWPRVGAYTYVPSSGRSYSFYETSWNGADYDPGYSYIPSNEIPIEIVRATCEAAVRELATPGSLQADLERGGRIHSLRAGSVEIVYEGSADPQTTFSIIDGILAGLLLSGGGGMFGVAVRG